MLVKFVRDWRAYRNGQTAEVDRGIGEVLIHRAFCQPAARPKRKRTTKKKAVVNADSKVKGHG